MYMRYNHTEHMLRFASTLLRVQWRFSPGFQVGAEGRVGGGGGGGGGGAHIGRVGTGLGESSPIESFAGSSAL